MKIKREKLKKEAPGMGIRMIILFGSHAVGKARPDSDYDVAVLTTPERNIKNSLKVYTDILFFLSDALDIPDQKLDLTNLNNAKPFLQYEIFSNSRLLYGDELFYTSLKITALQNNIDTKNLRELRSKIIHKRQKMIIEKLYA